MPILYKKNITIVLSLNKNTLGIGSPPTDQIPRVRKPNGIVEKLWKTIVFHNNCYVLIKLGFPVALGV